ncbi:MAG: hypothetical protein ACYC0B_08845 [Gemmatimonadaceae bacterium]
MGTMNEGAVAGAAARPAATGRRTNGAAMAATLAAGIGAAAMGLFVLLNAARVYTAPSIYPPAGGLSGRSTFAVVLWLAAWWILDQRWRKRDLAPGPIIGWTVALAAFSVLATFPPVWGLF